MSRRKSRPVGPTVGAAAQRILHQQLATVLKRLRKAAKAAPSDDHAVHQLRVATRRARAALDLFAPILADKPRAWFLKRLRKLRRAAGEARNIDVYAKRLAEQQTEIPDDVRKLLERRRERAHRPLAKLDRRWGDGKLWQRKEAALLSQTRSKKQAKIAQQPFAAFVPQALAPLAADFNRGLFPSDRSAAQLHRLRIAGKRLRYALELVADAAPKSKRSSLLKPLEKLQGVLGELNDLATAANLTGELAQRPGKRGARQWLKAERKRQRAAFSLARAKFLRGWTHQDRLQLLKRGERISSKAPPS